MIGGVDIELNGAEAEHLNHRGNYVRVGMNHMNGKQALDYARLRYIDSDFHRTNRQRNVITAIINQFRNASLKQITDTITAALKMVRTNMTDAEIMQYALELAPLLKDLKIVSQHIPVEGTYYYGGVREENIVDCIFIKDFETNRKLIADVMGG
jgi:anionic cell wall polymer biosynthesis LytR-Cps2A-Psr (LCP) family protein